MTTKPLGFVVLSLVYNKSMLKLDFNFKKDQLTLILILLFILTVSFICLEAIQLQKIKTDSLLTTNLLLKQANQLEELEIEVGQLQQVNVEELAQLKDELFSEKQKRLLAEEQQTKEQILAQQQILGLEEKITTVGKNELTKIVNQWSPYVVALKCSFYLPSTGELFLQSNGSGLLTHWGSGLVAVLTNKHIVSAISIGRDDLASECLIKFPQENISFTSKNMAVLSDKFDWGLITLDFSNEYIQALLQSPPNLCSENPTLGDGVVILGYPSIGDQKNVTVTDGIVSGFDDNYFITSAKVEKGNSGGAAISLGGNCYLGTPTFSWAGEIESLARILDVRVLFR